MDHELEFLTAKTNAYLGAARVPLDSLCFPPHDSVHVRNKKKEDRLLNNFAEFQCQRLGFRHRIPVVISVANLQAALNNSHLSSPSLFAVEPPLLQLPNDPPVVALRGRHRCEAARRYFQNPQDRWWTVTFYNKDGNFLIYCPE